jgi:hypothetical protein
MAHATLVECYDWIVSIFIFFNGLVLCVWLFMTLTNSNNHDLIWTCWQVFSWMSLVNQKHIEVFHHQVSCSNGILNVFVKFLASQWLKVLKAMKVICN